MLINSLFKSLLVMFVITAGLILSPTPLNAGEIPQLKISKGKGEQCVADKEFMRLNHMDLLRHDRDLTMHQGNRSIKYSLKECIACHAVDGPDGKPVSVKEPEHFCKSCHQFAAVTIDCFQCHASKPGDMPTTGINPHITKKQSSKKAVVDEQ